MGKQGGEVTNGRWKGWKLGRIKIHCHARYTIVDFGNLKRVSLVV
jgi:hypothetical protein